MRKRINLSEKELFTIKKILPSEAKKHEFAVILDSNNLKGWGNGTIKYVAGLDSIGVKAGSLSQLQAIHAQNNDWMMGHIGYDYKNQLEKLTSQNRNNLPLPDLHFFRPRYLFIDDNQGFRLEFDQSEDEIEVRDWLNSLINNEVNNQKLPDINFQPKETPEQYIHHVKEIQKQILRGNIYEMNYCTEFFAENTHIDPAQTWLTLIAESPTPFSAFLKHQNQYVIGASPERYLYKEGARLCSQPIKGTAARGISATDDEKQRNTLLESEKERAENIMIADLVRNDLAKVAQRGSVSVDELCGVYPFRQVWQLITTVSAQLDPKLHWTEALKATFPMGSMTGAPKISAMQLADQYESTRRGIYSGTIGYVTPNGDFDMNVVIRSLFYNFEHRYLYYMVGSAITSLSDPEMEHDECRLKGRAMMKIFSNKSND